MANTIIQDLIDEGVLELYIDFRSGQYYDRSGNGHVAAPTGVTLGLEGAEFPNSNSEVAIPDAAPFDDDTGCIGVMATSFSDSGNNTMAAKGFNLDHFIATGAVYIKRGATVSASTVLSGARMYATNFTLGAKPELYRNGKFESLYSAITTVFAGNSNDLLLGNFTTGGIPFLGTMEAFFWVSRELTAVENEAIYEALLDPYFGEAMPFQEGDVDLCHTFDGGDIIETNGITQMTGRFGPMTYMALFGGNEDDPGSIDTTRTWWGNRGVVKPEEQYRSQTQHLVKSIPLSSANLVRIQKANIADLERVFLPIDATSNIESAVSIPRPNVVQMDIVIEALGEREEFRFTDNWEAPQ